MKVSEFSIQHPEYAIDFTLPIRDQKRVFNGVMLDLLPLELEADTEYHSGGRGRPNTNQTLTHSQCATCQRVLRNDLFYTAPSMAKRNMVFSHCRECNQQRNAVSYGTKADLVRARRIVIWRYLAPRCAICGFDQHMSAMDIHHPDHKEADVVELITHVTLTADVGKVEVLLREATKCVPLCSNCHRMLHAQVIELPKSLKKPSYRIAELLSLLKSK
jgi:hypothetical protein